MIVAATILLIWFAGSILNQFFAKELATFNAIQALPNWKFFAPNPAVKDYHLLFRQRLSNSTLTTWSEAQSNSTRRFVPLFWNPKRRQEKALFDLISSFPADSREVSDASIKLSIPYLAVIYHVSNMRLFTEATEYQCLILALDKACPTAEAEVVLISEFHSTG